ncbi:hypothetical protein ACJ72_05729 [Emergomyces africanus]|uniref:Uncharacterized protein n=1 Tax=Emergomyces africanus TaxID=1955775 RepID=A0A1B7NT40_9EURO|nr:hypothetical protein ACJ72_05729 [Emergomyces africanus]
MYNIIFPGLINSSLSSQLHTEHLLRAYTPDPQSDKVHQHRLSMPMSMFMSVSLFSASSDLSKNAAINVLSLSLQLSDFSDNSIKKAHSSASDVTDDFFNQQESTLSPASEDHDDNTSKKSLNYSDGFIKNDQCLSEEQHIQAH